MREACRKGDHRRERNPTPRRMLARDPHTDVAREILRLRSMNLHNLVPANDRSRAPRKFRRSGTGDLNLHRRRQTSKGSSTGCGSPSEIAPASFSFDHTTLPQPFFEIHSADSPSSPASAPHNLRPALLPLLAVASHRIPQVHELITFSAPEFSTTKHRLQIHETE